MKTRVLTFLMALTFTLFGFSTAFADFAYGDRGDQVTDIQKQLVGLNYDVGGIDGIFGGGTEKAVKAFQKSKGLAVDGIVGRGTYRALMHGEMPPNRSGRSVITRRLLSHAYRYQGVRYVFGGTTPRGFDCSGYTQYVFRKAGVRIPRTSQAQYRASRKIKRAHLRPGDIVFFTTYMRGASHCGIYVGNGKFIHASSSRGIRVSSLSEAYWSRRYYGSGRIFY